MGLRSYAGVVEAALAAAGQLRTRSKRSSHRILTHQDRWAEAELVGLEAAAVAAAGTLPEENR